MADNAFFKISKSTVLFTIVTSVVFSSAGVILYMTNGNTVFIFLGIVFFVIGIWQIKSKVIILHDQHFEFKMRMLGQGMFIKYSDLVEIDLTKKSKPFFKYKLENSKIKKVKLPASMIGPSETERFFEILEKRITSSCKVNK